MHKRQRWILHLGLAAAAVWLAWRLGTEWTQANLRYGPAPAGSRTAERSPAPSAAIPPERREPPATEEIAAKNLFSADRTNVIALETVSQQTAPPPAVPVVLGTMKLGQGYEALMAESSDAARRGARRVKPGEEFGGYTVAEILDEQVVIEYRGQRTTVDVYQSARSVARRVARTETSSQPRVEATGSGSTPASARPASPAPSRPAAAGAQPAQPPPGTPPGTRVFVEGNRRRFERDTVFGVQTWYEPLEQPAPPAGR
jgi:hypothetical protein